MPIRRLRMPAGMGVNTLAPSDKLLKYGQSKSNVGLLFTKLLENIEEPGNYYITAFRCDLKRVTSLTSIPNIALETVNFYCP